MRMFFIFCPGKSPEISGDYGKLRYLRPQIPRLYRATIFPSPDRLVRRHPVRVAESCVRSCNSAVYPFMSRKDQFISWDRPLIAQIQAFRLSLCLKWQARAYSASKNSVKWQFVISGCRHILPSKVTSEALLFLSIAYIWGPSKYKEQ